MQPIDHDLDACAFRDPESGQASVLLLLLLSTFLLGMMAFAVDLTGLWFHRQAIQSAADSACLAGANDMLVAQAGITPPGTGFSPGTNGNCADSPTAPLCQYAAFNGYNGGGVNNVDGSNTVSWIFPGSVTGVTTPPGSYPFLQVTITENVKTYFAGLLHASQYQPVAATSTCAVAYVKEAPPVVVLNPVKSGSFTYTGGGALTIVGGPTRGLQVNSSSSTGILWHASGIVNLSKGGPNQTGSDVAVYGNATSGASTTGFSGGTTGHWSTHALPLGDPFASLGPPASVASITPVNTVNGKWVDYKVDGCPDHGGKTGTKGQACKEFSPGYYPSGLNIQTVVNGYSTVIFLPGVYYFNGSMTIGNSSSMRMAKPAGYQQTDGVMFYFLTGSVDISGCSGCVNSNVDNEPATSLSCDGSSPPASLNVPSSLSGNILWAQCADSGTYWDSGHDTTDFQGNPGSRGILIFHGHNDIVSPSFSGSGALSFAGTLYIHNSTYNDILSLSGGSSSGTLILGEIIADQISLTGSGMINLALNPAKSIEIAKVALVQ